MPLRIFYHMGMACSHLTTRDSIMLCDCQVCAVLFCWSGLLGMVGGIQALCAECFARHRSSAQAAASSLGLKASPPHHAVVHTCCHLEHLPAHLNVFLALAEVWSSMRGVSSSSTFELNGVGHVYG